MSKIEVKVVVGANYGDEGKGLVTRYLSQKAKKEEKSCVNILYNGGPQRGHTVELKDGTRHIFHHFGSGTFDGADTYFDQDFMVNPACFIKELETVGRKNKDNYPTVYISSECRVITPYDMIINQIVEENRKENKHGSCGHGIWETQQRYNDKRYSLYWGELIEKNDIEIMHYLYEISRYYLPERLGEYGIFNIPEEYNSLIKSYSLAKHYLTDLRMMQEYVSISSIKRMTNTYDVLIFEGGQGLALDENNEEAYPHVTASETGSYVPMLRLEESRVDADVEVCYVTRSYFTRHGAGPFPTECEKEKLNPKIEDETNTYNEFQEEIRYGTFDLHEFKDRVLEDLIPSKIVLDFKTSVFVTHTNYAKSMYGIIGDCSVNNLRTYFEKIYVSGTKYSEDITLL